LWSDGAQEKARVPASVQQQLQTLDWFIFCRPYGSSSSTAAAAAKASVPAKVSANWSRISDSSTSVHSSQHQLPVYQPWESKCAEATCHTDYNSESNREEVFQLWRKGSFHKCLPQAMCSFQPNPCSTVNSWS
jgi:hypothetical protein